MYHPAAALHQPSLRRTIEDDMRRIPELIADAAGVREEAPPEQTRQLSLF
jgi:DNA polymerase